MNAVALSRNPSRTAALWNAVAGLAALISRSIHQSMRTWKDRRALQKVPASLLADMGLERLQVVTTSGDQEVWLKPHRC